MNLPEKWSGRLCLRIKIKAVLAFSQWTQLWHFYTFPAYKPKGRPSDLFEAVWSACANDFKVNPDNKQSMGK